MIARRFAMCAAVAATLAGGPAADVLASGPIQAATVDESADFSLTGAIVQGGVALGTAPRGAVALRLDDAGVPLDPDGRFVIGFDRDAGPAAVLAATLRDGRTLRRTLDVAPRAWRIERLDRLPRISQPSEAFARARPAELAQIVAARAMTTTARGWRQRFGWPALGRISGLFGAQRVYRGEPGAYHSGVDVARAEGAAVVAPADGIVILAAERPFTLEGNLLMIDHGHGLNSAFLHLSRIDVRIGDSVRQGETIGAVGRTGRATGPHLHWAVKWREARVDPMLLAGSMPIAN